MAWQHIHTDPPLLKRLSSRSRLLSLALAGSLRSNPECWTTSIPPSHQGAARHQAREMHLFVFFIETTIVNTNAVLPIFLGHYNNRCCPFKSGVYSQSASLQWCNFFPYSLLFDRRQSSPAHLDWFLTEIASPVSMLHSSWHQPKSSIDVLMADTYFRRRVSTWWRWASFSSASNSLNSSSQFAMGRWLLGDSTTKTSAFPSSPTDIYIFIQMSHHSMCRKMNRVVLKIT